MSHRRWTQDDDDVLIALVGQTDPRMSWAAIGERFGVTRQAAFDRHKKVIGLRGLPPKQGLATRWTDAEDAELLRRCDASESFAALARDLGRSRAACKQRYNILKRGAARPVAIFAAVRADPAHNAAVAEAERLRRNPPVHQSITARFCGDPLPGRSALDQMRGEHQITRDRFAPTLATEPLR